MINDKLTLVVPYLSTYGKLLPIDDTVKKVAMVLTDDVDRSYGYSGIGSVGQAFITGVSYSEAQLPVWNEPAIVTSSGGNITVATDLRSWVKKSDNMKNLSDNFRSHATGTLAIYKALLIQHALADDLRVFSTTSLFISTAFGKFLSTMLDSKLNLNIFEKNMVDVAATYHMLAMCSYVFNGNGSDNELLVDKMMNIKSFDLSVGVSGLTALFNETYVPSYGGLVDAMNRALLSIDSELVLTKNVVTVALSNTLVGNNPEENIQISVDNLPTWMSVLLTVFTDPWYRKSKLFSILDKNKRKLDPVEYIRTGVEFIKECGGR